MPVDANHAFLEAASRLFHEMHRRRYGYSLDSEPVEVVNCKVSVWEDGEKTASPVWATPDIPTATAPQYRSVVDAGGSRMPMPIARRPSIQARRRGPLILEESNSTIFIPSGWSVSKREEDCLLLARVI